MRYPKTLDRLRARCVEVGDCWEWQGYFTSTGQPGVRWHSNNTSARRVALQLVNPTPPEPGQDYALCTCGNPRCINPKHARWASKSECMLAGHRKNLRSDLPRAAKIAATQRATRAKITMAQAQDIRTSTDTLVQLAARYGISRNYVSRIRAHQAWRDYTSHEMYGVCGACNHWMVKNKDDPCRSCLAVDGAAYPGWEPISDKE